MSLKHARPCQLFSKSPFFSDAHTQFPFNFFLVRFIDPRFFAQPYFVFPFPSISFHYFPSYFFRHQTFFFDALLAKLLFPMKSYIIKPAN
jgi:hypothetical protein